jgi:RNA polymerase sigma-70 factor (ECF subfamily)
MSAGRVLAFRPRAEVPVALSDEALIAACATGDEAGLALLFERHSRVVYRYLSRMVSDDPGEVDDLAQTVFIEVWRSSGKFHQRSSARVWLFGIAHNVARTALRTRRRRHAAIDRLAAQPEPRERGVDEQLADRAFVGELAEALSHLSEGQRGAFVLCELEELTGVEAARVLDARPGTVGRWLSEARQILRAHLEDPR